MRVVPFALGVCLLTASGCHPTPLPEVPVPPPEDLSTWAVPALVQPERATPGPTPATAPPRPGPAEKVYDYAPGTVYQVRISLDAPLDIILEQGEQVRNIMNSDPQPIAPGEHARTRWEVKEGVDGREETASPHLFIRATEAGATMGVTITTTKRVYYLTCKSVVKSPVRAVRWTYARPADEGLAVDGHPPGLLPDPSEPRRYHVGYQLTTSHPTPAWTPRQVVDDGKKLYLLYPEVTLFGTVPLVRAVGPNGPQLINVRQFLNVVILDALAAKVELRVGIGEGAETVTITRGHLRTITCPEDGDCPRWPDAAQTLARR